MVSISCHLDMQKNYATSDEARALPITYQLRDIDIVCGRGKGSWDHVGNRMFREFVAKHAQRYAVARNKIAKTGVIISVVDEIREQGVLFVRNDRKLNRWFEIGRQEAQKKTGHAIRDHLSRYKKSNKNTFVSSHRTGSIGTDRQSDLQGVMKSALRNEGISTDHVAMSQLNGKITQQWNQAASMLSANIPPRNYANTNLFGTHPEKIAHAAVVCHQSKEAPLRASNKDNDNKKKGECFDEDSIASCSSLAMDDYFHNEKSNDSN